MTTNMELIGRDEINDLEAILSVCNTDADAIVHAVKANADAVFTWDYERSRTPLIKLYEKAKTSQWNVTTDLDWSTEVDQVKLALENVQADQSFFSEGIDLKGTPVREVDREGVGRVRRRVAELAALAVHARRAGRAALHGPHRRDRAVDRREVLRRHAGDGRGPPRRGVRQVPRREALRSLPDQRAPRPAARRHPRRQPLGHDLPRHADHGRGPGARRVRLPAPDDHRAVAQAVAPLRDERRSAPRRVRRALVAGVLQGAQRRGDEGAPGVHVRSRRPHARPLPAARGVGAHGRAGEGRGASS